MDEAAGSRDQLDKALARFPWVEPTTIAIFGGVLDPAKLRFPFSRMPAFDARDWYAIEAWAEEIANDLGYGKPAPERRDRRSELQETPR
jgi:menaquinone-dependent protoporphyrinogen IX oxidase